MLRKGKLMCFETLLAKTKLGLLFIATLNNPAGTLVSRMHINVFKSVFCPLFNEQRTARCDGVSNFWAL